MIQRVRSQIRVRRWLTVVMLLVIGGLMVAPVQGQDVEADVQPAVTSDALHALPYLREKASDGSWRTQAGNDYHFSQPQAPLRAAGVDAAAAIVSDDFARPNLDPARWTLVNPLDAGSVRMVGAGSADAMLELSLPSGPSHDPWNVNRSLRVMQSVGDGDFQTVVKFASQPTAPYQMQGLIFEQDQDNWMRIEFQHDGVDLFVFAAATLNGSSVPINASTVAGSSALFLRVTRSGNDWTVDSSSDGTNWTSAFSFTQAITVNAIGPFVANHQIGGGSAPAVTAKVDYFFNVNAAIQPEDGSTATDVWAPLIHAQAATVGTTGASIAWKTDEPATGTVEYGSTTAYGFSLTTGAAAHSQQIEISGLTPGESYHYRIKATDGVRESVTSDGIFTVGETAIEIWYGDRQNVGQLGVPQTWVNILGNVPNAANVSTLSYRLNGGSSVALTIGPDSQRLQNLGDFNIDLPESALQQGENTLAIRATLWNGQQIDKTVIINNQDDGVPWPLPYAVDWSTVGNPAAIQNVAHVVDGKWRLENGLVRTDEPGYDRLLAIGDVAWQDFEVTVPVLIHDEPLDTDRGLGLLMRWTGHTDLPPGNGECSQPKCGWQPLGGLAWYHNQRLELYSYDPNQCATNNCAVILGTPKPMALTPGVPYWFKARVETSGATGLYSFKVWPASSAEPPTWDTSGAANPAALARGSLLLLSHRIDVSFGNVQVQPLNGAPNMLPTAQNDALTVQNAASAVIDVLDNDSDADGSLIPASVRIVTAPAYGAATVNPSTGTITYSHGGQNALTDTFTYTVEDDLGATSNVATVTVTVDSVLGSTRPVISLLGDSPLIVEVFGVYTDPGATAVDDVDGDISDQIVVGGDSVDVNTVGEYSVTYDVVDSAGNPAVQQIRTVMVVDSAPPQIILNGDNPMFVAQGAAYEEPGAQASDNYDGAVAVVVAGDVVDTAVPGQYTVTYRAVDTSGNAATAARTVNVGGLMPPTLTLLGDNPLTVEAGRSFAEVDPGAVASNGEVDLSDRIVVDTAALDMSTPGAYVVVYSVRDDNNNEASKSRAVYVIDANPPTLTLIGANPLVIAYGSSYADPGATAMDDVEGNLSAQVVVGGDVVDPLQPGEYVVTYDITDSSGNQAEQISRVVRVVHVVHLPTIISR